MLYLQIQLNINMLLTNFQKIFCASRLKAGKEMKKDDFYSILNDWKVSAQNRLKALQTLVQNSSPCKSAVCEVDLHLHTFYSDGYSSPAGLVFDAWNRSMKSIAITDHDNFDGCVEAVMAGRITGVDVVPGIEFYTDRPGVEIIAYWPVQDYFLDWYEKGTWATIIEPIRKAKQHQLKRMMDRVPECMAKKGFKAVITQEDIDLYVRNGVSTKGDISVIMWQKYGPALDKKKIASNVKEFQALYTTQDDQLNVPLELDMDLSAGAFIRSIMEWHGIAGLSHPTELRKKEGLDNSVLVDLIEQLGGIGMQAVEVDGWRNGIDPETGRRHTDLFVEMVNGYNSRHHDRLPLLMTSGSDNHDQPGEGLETGCGRNRNMCAEIGSYKRVEYIRNRFTELYGSRR